MVWQLGSASSPGPRRRRKGVRCTLLLAATLLLGGGGGQGGSGGSPGLSYSGGGVGSLLPWTWQWGMHRAGACSIAGYESGICMDTAQFDFQLDFCSELIKYRTCMPKADSNFPNHTIAGKDAWIEKTYNEIVAQRIAAETERLYIDNQINEYGDPGIMVPRFSDPQVIRCCVLLFSTLLCLWSVCFPCARLRCGNSAYAWSCLT
jgi:hypothetical protein